MSTFAYCVYILTLRENVPRRTVNRSRKGWKGRLKLPGRGNWNRGSDSRYIPSDQLALAAELVREFDRCYTITIDIAAENGSSSSSGSPTRAIIRTRNDDDGGAETTSDGGILVAILPIDVLCARIRQFLLHDERIYDRFSFGADDDATAAAAKRLPRVDYLWREHG